MIGPRFLIESGRRSYGNEDGWWIAADLDLILDTQDLRVWSEAGPGIIIFSDASGIVIGRLFRKGEQSPVSALSRQEEQNIVETQGDALARQYWGGFVGIVRRPDGGVSDIYRDPSPEKPCYYFEQDGGLIFASDVGLLNLRRGRRAPIDWDYIASYLWRPQIRPRRTGLAGVTELLAGERLTHARGGISRTISWSPWTFTGRGLQIADEMEARRQVRATVEGAVLGWATCFDHILLGVSGGLDSSILAAVLNGSAVELTMLTMATQGRSGDERAQCRELGEWLSKPVIEVMEDPQEIDLQISDAAHLPRPAARAFSQSSDRALQRVATEHDVGAYMHGGGGDNVFCYLTSGGPLADRIKSEGVGRGAWQTATDISVMTGSSLGKVLKSAVRRGWFREQAYRWPLQGALLHASTRSAVEKVGDHPWMSVPDGALPGKATHVAWLLGVQNALEGFARERERPMLAPLLSQPIMETCLQIPTWLWVSGGINRATARSAFADKLPPRVLARRGKGTPDSLAIEILEDRRDEITDMLLGGALAHHGILVRGAVESALSQCSAIRDGSFVSLLRLVDVEAWIRAVAD